ncbi:hypothetical protein ABT120_28625 [Nonomuraea angiospora]|uniref:hypothetical protein n=1 Tax=Nonomuraea angiospora TaxID=46172 RepID=UPI0033173909
MPATWSLTALSQVMPSGWAAISRVEEVISTWLRASFPHQSDFGLTVTRGTLVMAQCPGRTFLESACLAMGMRSGVLTTQDAAQKYQPWSSKQGWVCVPPACTPFLQYSQIPLVE